MSIYNNLLSLLSAKGYRYFFLAIASISIKCLAFAFFVEYVLGYDPCVLCLYQRIPYFLLIILSIAGSVSANNRWILFALALTIFSAVGLSAYHTGVERGLFDPTATCNIGVKIPDNLSVEEVRELLYNAPIATCTVASFKIFRISMTEWNLIMNICLMVVTILVIRKKGSR